MHLGLEALGQHTSPGRAWAVGQSRTSGCVSGWLVPQLSQALPEDIVCSPDYQLQPATLKILCCEDFLRFRFKSLCAPPSVQEARW